jgi:hypothetical protein
MIRQKKLVDLSAITDFVDKLTAHIDGLIIFGLNDHKTAPNCFAGPV